MCGIAGFIDKSDISFDRKRVLSHMLFRIRHRGPDETGAYLDRDIAMGSVRLSIIDIQSGQQPICNENQRFWIVFNGEIFNYIELKEELVKKGHVFQSNSDTEVLVHLYEEYGPDCLNMLNGQFAISIWDKHKKELFLARDRVGIRPLFYYNDNSRFVYGSEIKAILEYPGIPRKFNMQGISQVFTFWTTLTPDTVFQDIYELPPGHFAIVNKKGITTQAFWKLTYPTPDNMFKGTEEEALEEFESLFLDATKLRLRADVQVAAYLSGGIDSSVTTAFIKKVSPDILNTYSIGFTDADFDETDYQNEVSAYLNTRHVGFKCSEEDIANAFPDVIRHTEFPLLRTSPAPMYLLSKKVHEENIKVVVTGEGADEMLAGYNIFKEAIIREFWAREPKSQIRPLLLKKLYPYLPMMKNANVNMLRMFFGYQLSQTDSPLYSHALRWHNTSNIQKHFADPLKGQLNGYSPLSLLEKALPEGFNDWPMLSKAQYLETTIFMSGYLLSSQGDRMAMGNSVEGRYPFLDYRVIEFCTSLPPHYKLKGLNEKVILKKLMKGKLPERILKRPKQAYRAPIFKAFWGENKPEYVKELLSAQRLKDAGIFNPESVGKFLQKIEKAPSIAEVDNMTLAGVLSTQLIDHLFMKNTTKLQDSDIEKLQIRFIESVTI